MLLLGEATTIESEVPTSPAEPIMAVFIAFTHASRSSVLSASHNRLDSLDAANSKTFIPFGPSMLNARHRQVLAANTIDFFRDRPPNQ